MVEAFAGVKNGLVEASFYTGDLFDERAGFVFRDDVLSTFIFSTI